MVEVVQFYTWCCVHNIIQLHGCVPFYIQWRPILENKKKLAHVIMKNGGMISKNIMNNVGIFKDSVAMNSISSE